MIEAYFSLVVFVTFMVATPGPANLLAMIGGAQLGLRQCLPFILGLVTGKLILNFAFGVGFGLALIQQPLVLQVLKFGSAAVTIWLAMQSWNDRPKSAGKTHTFAFRYGVIVHPLNPKAWVMTLLAWTQFAPDLGHVNTQLLLVPLTFAGCQLLFHSGWCAAGAALQRSFSRSLLLTRCLIVLTVSVVIWALYQ